MAAVWSRINTFFLVLILLALVALIGLVATRAEGGPLDPPGAPGSTNGVRLPGTPITSLPAVINEPGMYYLTGNLTATVPGPGITIGTSRVTLDLNGFLLDGNGIGTIGVQANFGATVRNGSVRFWTDAGVSVAIGHIENMRAEDNGNVGISLFGGDLTGCYVERNATTGVSASLATVSNCTALQNDVGFDLVASSLLGCTTSSNTVAGIDAERSIVKDCVSSGDQFGILAGDDTTVHGNNVNSSRSDCIHIPETTQGALVSENRVSQCGQAGFGTGIGLIGFDSRVTRNSVSRNLGPGIYVQGGGNTIDENSSFRNNGTGIVVVAVAAATKNTVVRNSAVNNAGGVNYSIAAGNNPGTVITANTTSDWSNTQ